ncbi:MAG: hypothetical protein PHO91_03095 [Patescibacteria group bacterium]|nr:hypothetical protein [Patescibacteria group bacterium]
MKNKQGISIIEIIITIFIVSALTGMGVAVYINWQKQSKLVNTADEIKSVLIRAQQLATAAAKSSDWGVRFEEGNYTLFAGTFYNQNDPENISWQLSGVEIIEPESIFSDGGDGYIPDVVFRKYQGTTDNVGLIRIRLASDPTWIRNVEVFSSGQIR